MCQSTLHRHLKPSVAHNLPFTYFGLRIVIIFSHDYGDGQFMCANKLMMIKTAFPSCLVVNIVPFPRLIFKRWTDQTA